ncbi:MAG TPA: shikimate dehydrogenase [Euzebya sp.]|nr:shikimate dehydrogenase [Euzebya sp.]
MRRRVALIGQPLRRRHSQVMHDAAFAATGIDARYELREVGEEGLGAFVAEVRDDPAWYGFQITAPHKQAIVGLLDRVDPDATAIGAVNSVQRLADGSLVGFNTDAPGFVAAVRRDLGSTLMDAHVVLLGAGGAARAVATACLRHGAASLMIANRTPATAVALAAAINATADPTSSGTGTASLGCGLDDPALPDRLARADLLVNATTVGMTSPGLPVDISLVSATTAVLDLVYVPPQTPLLAAARARDLVAANGAGMLVAQAAIAWMRWTAAADPTDVMRAALAGMSCDGGAA